LALVKAFARQARTRASQRTQSSAAIELTDSSLARADAGRVESFNERFCCYNTPKQSNKGLLEAIQRLLRSFTCAMETL
jgi:hypothetical protein